MDLAPTLEQHRVELTGYCYRMLGSAFEAEDAVQEAFIRAMKGYDQFAGRAAFKSWLYRIATNVCLNMLNETQRRARPMDLGPASKASAALGPALAESMWLEPIPDTRVLPADADPAEQVIMRESVRLAFVAALQYLPPKQRAILILREVLHYKADEVAQLLGSTVAAVNSGLQRARTTLADTSADQLEPTPPRDHRQMALLDRYVHAFERYDMDSLTSLLHEDASWAMPPYELWLQTHADIRQWCLGPGIGCRGSRLLPTAANGAPAYGQYKPSPRGGLDAWALQVLDIANSQRINGIIFFLDTARFFPMFGLPPHLD